MYLHCTLDIYIYLFYSVLYNIVGFLRMGIYILYMVNLHACYIRSNQSI